MCSDEWYAGFWASGWLVDSRIVMHCSYMLQYAAAPRLKLDGCRARWPLIVTFLGSRGNVICTRILDSISYFIMPNGLRMLLLRCRTDLRYATRRTIGLPIFRSENISIDYFCASHAHPTIFRRGSNLHVHTWGRCGLAFPRYLHADGPGCSLIRRQPRRLVLLDPGAPWPHLGSATTIGSRSLGHILLYIAHFYYREPIAVVWKSLGDEIIGH